MGEEPYRAFFETFLHDFVTDADAAHLASPGVDHVRIPVNHRHFEDDENPFELKTEGFEHLNRMIDLLAARCTRSPTCTRCPAARASTGTATTPRADVPAGRALPVTP
ncbi:hypothetical protein [Saccharopolyspora griseoalba]|uniref:Uncharacterized protein n=1 Tax=Saccharopolyspora griseoalba TaxID=1431848 RepID=A0ABW2LCF6_9PSEU